ncbi:MAG: site-2 protease family protein [Oscillospiraceae bacterium]
MLRFKLGKLHVQIDFMFVAVVTIFLIVDTTGISSIALLACFIHELGHIVMFLAVGYTPQKLTFELTGIRLTKPIQELSAGKELLVQLAGSTTNLLIFFFLIKTIESISFLSLFAVTHLVLGVFNLLPLKSFDGGKILELILSFFLCENVTQKICSIADFICIFLMLIVCVFMIITSKNSFTLLMITIYLMISSLIKLMKRY